MEESVDMVPEYMVAVKSAYLVDHKGKGKKDVSKEVDSKATENPDTLPAAADESQSLPNGFVPKGGDSPLRPDEIDCGTGVQDGYKSNGYKIDERDKQSASWDKKKDYTGGEFCDIA